MRQGYRQSFTAKERFSSDNALEVGREIQFGGTGPLGGAPRTTERIEVERDALLLRPTAARIGPLGRTN